jgi:hypothetical protein
MVTRSPVRPRISARCLGAAVVMALLPAVASPDCNPFCFEAVASDILLTGGSGWNTLPVAQSRLDGTFTVTNAYVGVFGAWAAHPSAKKLTGDFDGNGWTDVALTGVPGWNTVPIALANGNGTFNVVNSYVGVFGAWAATPGAVALTGDYNGDGRTDIALTGGSGWGSVPVAMSFGNGYFIIHNQGVSGFASWAANSAVVKLVGDFNGDGNSDIALTGGAEWWSVPVALSNSFGGFIITNASSSFIAGFAQLATTPGASRLVGDFDGDGRTDIAVIADPDPGAATIAIAHSTCGTFQCSFIVSNFHPPNVPQPWGTFNFAVFAGLPNAEKRTGDFNGDGRTDIALLYLGIWQPNGSEQAAQAVALSNGNGTFQLAATYGSGARLGLFYNEGPTVEVVVGDYNGDTRSDLILVGLDPNPPWPYPEALLGSSRGDGTFQHISVPLGDFGYWAYQTSAVKLGGDFN